MGICFGIRGEVEVNSKIEVYPLAKKCINALTVV